MEHSKQKVKDLIHNHQEDDFIELLRAGFDPNLEGGWPIRLAARHGCTNIVEALLQFGANPHLLSESGKTLEVLAKAYKLSEFMKTSTMNELSIPTTTATSRMSRQDRMEHAPSSPFHSSHRNLSPSVAHFFNQTANQSSLSPSRNTIIITSPTRGAHR
ncbi:hypothetical protein HW555_009918 [Spodoptera exigua]|uniref:Uncharacterized protein n=1 Tax=Spodoptera exigua TaxID=7107 RepID=A0A835G8C2_SPOEX|nr:hypothetical protein HW555_009918 [Spodoptera exigua]